MTTDAIQLSEIEAALDYQRGPGILNTVKAEAEKSWKSDRRSEAFNQLQENFIRARRLLDANGLNVAIHGRYQSKRNPLTFIVSPRDGIKVPKGTEYHLDLNGTKFKVRYDS